MTPVSQLRGPSREHLAWPFFDSRHAEYAAALDAFAASLGDTHGGDVDETCRSLVRQLGAAGLLEASVAGNQPDAVIDSRLICLARETLAWHSGLADVYTLFARTGEAPGARGISAFLVLPDDPGFSIADRIDVMAPHPLATLRFDACRIPAARLLGSPGEGFKIAMRTLDIFRASVAAAALGFARRALDEATMHARTRRMFGGVLGDQQLTQAALRDMAAGVDASALLTYRAAWRRDVQKASTTREAAMAKMVATETAQEVIDRAVQMFGGRGVRSGEMVEQLYREIRALRIYEGATEVQKLIIGRDVLKVA